MGQALRLSVPTQGIHFAFEKLYASQSDEVPWFAVQYTSHEGYHLGLLAGAAGVVLIRAGIFGPINISLSSIGPDIISFVVTLLCSSIFFRFLTLD